MKKDLTLVTIVAESLLREQVISSLRQHGASGFTITKVEGEGSRGTRARDWEGPNLKFESIVDSEAGDKILQDLGRKFFEHYAVIAWLSPATVLRGEKFAG